LKYYISTAQEDRTY